jgi:hypothetical protein
MLSVSDRLLRIFAWRPKRAPLADRALAVLRDRFSPCSICGASLQGHAFVKFASALVNDSAGRDQELERLISTRQWKQAFEYQDWISDRSVREYYLIRCPHSSQIALTKVLSTPEMWTDDQVQASETLGQEDSQRILEVVGDRWVTQ